MLDSHGFGGTCDVCLQLLDGMCRYAIAAGPAGEVQQQALPLLKPSSSCSRQQQRTSRQAPPRFTTCTSQISCDVSLLMLMVR